ncbi:MAG: DNA-binding protein [Actinobacteria bacterium]|jgi:excisionase family DNA binding protein|nr:DNA-binding protein [Actinomycetota bacterium]
METGLQEELSSPLLTVEEASQYLKIGRSSLYNLMDKGLLTPVNIVPKRVTFLKSDLDVFISSRKVRTTRDV